MSPHCLEHPLRRGFALAATLALVVLASPALAGGLGGFGGSWYSFAGAAPGAAGAGDDEASHVLRVCADPDNPPYSKRDGSGFENRIATVVAGALQARLEYVWAPQHRGFVRKTLGAGACDLLIGVPTGFAPVLTTRPYYRSSYAFIGRADNVAPLRGFNDERLAQLRIGVQSAANELSATTPGYTLARFGATNNVIDYATHGDGPVVQRMLEALTRGELDAALVSSPQAGYLAQRAGVPLRIERAEPPAGLESALEYPVSMGVRMGHESLRAALDQVIDAYRGEIDAILRSYGVPSADVRAANAVVLDRAR